jgi:tRNA nucleotidyltransferase/poly(A) polymerase
MKSFLYFLKESFSPIIIKLSQSEIEHFKSAELMNNLLEQNGFSTALVGGASRDLLARIYLNEQNNINDLDFAIFTKEGLGLTPEQLSNVKQILEQNDYTVIDEIKFLHLKVYDKNKNEIEYTSLRKEAYRDSSRKPETSVGNFSSDVQRRDFTIGAIYLKILKITNDTVTVIPVNEISVSNIEDLKNKLLKTTDSPEEIFEQDPLRILRAIRFHKKYKMNKDVENAVKNFPKEDLFKKVSIERIADELIKILLKGDVDYLINSGFINKIIPQFSKILNKNEIINIIEKCRSVDNSKTMLLTSLLFKLDSAEVKSILTNMRFPNKIINSISNIITNINDFKNIKSWNKYQIINLFLNLNIEQIDELIIFNYIVFGDNGVKSFVKNYSQKLIPLIQKHKSDLSNIGTEIGKNKNIPNNEKAAVVNKQKIKFLLNQF